MVDGDSGATDSKVNLKRLLCELGDVKELSDLEGSTVGNIVGVDRLDLVLVARLRLESGSRGTASPIRGAGETNEKVSFSIKLGFAGRNLGERRRLTLGGILKSEVVASVNFVGVVPGSRRSRSLFERRSTRPSNHVESSSRDIGVITGLGAKGDRLGLGDRHLSTSLLAALPGTDNGKVVLPHLELGSGTIRSTLSGLVDVGPDAGLYNTSDLRLLTEEVVVLAAASPVVDDDSVLVDHCGWISRIRKVESK